MAPLTDPRRWSVDAVIALALSLTSQLEIWAPGAMPGIGEQADEPVTLSLTTLAMTVPLALRRTAPLLVLVLSLGASALQQVLTAPNEGLSTLVALLVASYTAAAHARLRGVVAAGAAVVVGSAVIGEDTADRVFILIVLGAAWLAGLIVGQRSGELARLADDNRELAERLDVAAARLREAEIRQRQADALDGVPAARPEELSGLTGRELEVVRLIATGMSNAEIAADLVISEWTVKTHVASVLRKLGVRDRAQVVVAAYESRLVEPGGQVGRSD
jgi:DNA-binding CsgD family transcriptional regulator